MSGKQKTILDSIDAIDGGFYADGVWGDVVAERGRYASIYGWTGDGAGATREALRA